MYAMLLSAVLAQGVSDDTILIGMEKEVQSFPAQEENLGMRLVIQHTNATGGVHGRQLVEEGYVRPREDYVKHQLANAKRLVEEDGVFMLFNFGGPGSMTLGPYAMKKQVPYMFPHTALLTMDGGRYVFTSYPRYDGETEVMLRHLATDRDIRNIGVIYANNAYGQYFASRASLFSSTFGYNLVGVETLSRGQDAMEGIKRLEARNADAIIMAVYPRGALSVIKAKASLDRDVMLVSSGPLTDEQYFTSESELAEGTLGFCHYPDPTESDAPGIVEYRQLMERYYPDHPVNRYSLYGYVMGSLVVEGLRRAGPGLTRESFIDAMESIEGWDSGGIMPPVSFSTSDHHAQTAGFICELRDGRFRPLTGWVEPDVPISVEPLPDPDPIEDEPIRF